MNMLFEKTSERRAPFGTIALLIQNRRKSFSHFLQVGEPVGRKRADGKDFATDFFGDGLRIFLTKFGLYKDDLDVVFLCHRNQPCQFLRAGLLSTDFNRNFLQAVIAGKVAPGGMKNDEFLAGCLFQRHADLGIQRVNILKEGIEIGFVIGFVRRVEFRQRLVDGLGLNLDQCRREPDVRIKSAIGCGDAIDAWVVSTIFMFGFAA